MHENVDNTYFFYCKLFAYNFIINQNQIKINIGKCLAYYLPFMKSLKQEKKRKLRSQKQNLANLNN